MKTYIHLQDANCPVCLDEVADRIRQRPLVAHVELSSTGQCLEVDHADDDVDTLLSTVRTSLRGFVVADNSETVQTQVGATLGHVCDAHAHH